MLVSTALVAVIMLLLLSTVDSTQRLWQRTTAKATQFQAARNGFEAMTRRMSQATLNTYWSAYDPDRKNVAAEFRYRRRSELQFMSGPTMRIFGSPLIGNLNPEPELAYPTHAVFFQAPLGYTEEGLDETKGVRQFAGADSLLSACGYFLEFGDDPERPDFLTEINYPPKYRSRLMELSVPAERLTVYDRPETPEGSRIDQDLQDLDQIVRDEKGEDYVGLVETTRQPSESFVRPFWMKEGLARETQEKGVTRFKFARPLADNIVALIVLPKLPQQDRVAADRLDELAPSYEYDSWRILMKGNNEPIRNSARDNLLPQIVQVIMVAVDEASALRKNATPDDPPGWTEELFQKVTTEADLQDEIATLEKRLREDPAKVTHRVFSTDVVIRGSKWSAKN